MTRREKVEQAKAEARQRAERLRVERASQAIRISFESRRAKVQAEADGTSRELPDVWDGRFR